jgi:osmoprotectant transport system permease protein
VSEQLALLPGYLTAHLQLSLAALLLGAIVSLPLGVWVSGRPRAEAWVLGTASIVQTIPGLALLALMVPALALLAAALERCCAVELSSIGFLPALVALTLYSCLPILRNTATGIAGVDPALVEAARGVGMTERQILWQVQLPLALPIIVAGLRTSTVWVVGTATLATPVGATSLGNYIFSGLQTRNFAAVCIGSVAAAALALLLDGLIRALELGIARRSRAAIRGAAAALLGLYIYAAAGLVGGSGETGAKAIAIGAKTFTEQYILAELIAQQIQDQTPLRTRAVPSLGSSVAFDALRSGDIDVYVDYSGTIWATVMERDQLPEDRGSVLAEVSEYLAREHDILLVGSLGFENTYALAIRAGHGSERRIASFSDLAAASSELEIGGDYEFFARPEWASLVKTYGFEFRAKRSMDSALMYQAAANGDVDVISAFSTDGRISAFDLQLLVDDRGVIPPYDAVLLAHGKMAREAPEVIEALRRLVGRIDEPTMQRMNLEVDREGKSPAAVARDFLLSEARDAAVESSGDGSEEHSRSR